VPSAAIPVKGRVFNVWDTAVGIGVKNDFTVGIAAILTEDGKLYVYDGTKSRFRPAEKAYQIVKLARQTLPEKIAIENAQGIENLQPEIQRVAIAHRVELPIRFFPPKNTYNAGGERIKGLEVLLTSGRLFFSASLPFLEEMYTQFTRFTGQKTGKKDDIIDAISFLQKFIPGPENKHWLEQETKDKEEERKKALEKQLYNTIFGPSLAEARVGKGPATQEPAEEPEKRNPLNSIFGDTGIRAY
jgi:predicted phage terminase large subunit-like protein